MTVTKQLALALSDALQNIPAGSSIAARGREALDAYKASAEFKREQFENNLHAALATANELVDTVAELCKDKDLNDFDSAHLSSAMQTLAEGADHLNTVVEGLP